MRIGIGVTTYNRPEHLELWKRQMDKFCPKDFIIHIADDSKDRRGVARRKNECLNALKDCDYIFLFDDDCFPIKDGWVDFFIDAHKASGEHHFLYLKETPTIKKMKIESGICFYNNCGGCFMFLTKEVIEKVGGFNKGYWFYGFEHAGYSQRIYQAGLISHPFICPVQASEYIYSLDYDFHIDFKIKHISSQNDYSEVKRSLEKNSKQYTEDIKTTYQPL